MQGEEDDEVWKGGRMQSVVSRGRRRSRQTNYLWQDRDNKIGKVTQVQERAEEICQKQIEED